MFKNSALLSVHCGSEQGCTILVLLTTNEQGNAVNDAVNCDAAPLAGKRTPVKDEFMRCLMEMKYLAEGTTVDLGGKRRKQGAKIAATLGLSESLLQEKVYKEILLQELQNVFLKFIEVSRGGRAFTSLVFGMGQMSEEGVTKKIAQQISMIAFRAPHLLHMEKEFALLQEAALEAFRQVYPNREHFLKK